LLRNFPEKIAQNARCVAKIAIKVKKLAINGKKFSCSLCKITIAITKKAYFFGCITKF